MRGKKKALPLPELGTSLVPRNRMEFYSINYFSFIGFICSEHYIRSRPCFFSSPKQRSNRKAGNRGCKPLPVPTLARNIPLALFSSTPLSFTPLTPPSFPKKTVKDITGLEGFKLEWGGKNTGIQRGEKLLFSYAQSSGLHFRCTSFHNIYNLKKVYSAFSSISIWNKYSQKTVYTKYILRDIQVN